jgi:hypothetical protein
MLIAKIIDRKGFEIFAEVLKAGQVLFDDRNGWILLSFPLDVPPRRRDICWMHPADYMFVWVRQFCFARAS